MPLPDAFISAGYHGSTRAERTYEFDSRRGVERVGAINKQQGRSGAAKNKDEVRKGALYAPANSGAPCPSLPRISEALYAENALSDPIAPLPPTRPRRIRKERPGPRDRIRAARTRRKGTPELRLFDAMQREVAAEHAKKQSKDDLPS